MASSLMAPQYSNDKVSHAFRIVETVIDAAHHLIEARAKTAEVRAAQESDEYEVCYQTAQTYLHQYQSFINSLASITQIHIVYVSEEEARAKDIAFWKDSLCFLEMVIYANVAARYGLQAKIKSELEKAFFSEPKHG